MSKKFAVILIILANTIWGGSFLFSKIAMDYADPVMLLSLRFIIALLSMVLMSLIFHKKREFQLHYKGKNLKPLIITSLFQPVAYFYFEAAGIKATSAVISSVTIAMVPIIAIFLESYAAKAKVPADKLFFSVVSVVGVGLVSLSGQSEEKTSLAGILFLVLAVISAVGFNYTSQKSAADFTVFERTFFMFFMGAAFYTGVAVVAYFGNWGAFLEPFTHAEFNFAVFYLGVLSSVVAFYFANYALTKLSVSETTIFNTIITVVGVVGGVTLLHEPLSLLKLLGCIVIIFGLIGFNRQTA